MRIVHIVPDEIHLLRMNFPLKHCLALVYVLHPSTITHKYTSPMLSPLMHNERCQLMAVTPPKCGLNSPTFSPFKPELKHTLASALADRIRPYSSHSNLLMEFLLYLHCYLWYVSFLLFMKT